MKKTRSFCLIISAILIINNCDDFGSINIDPNNPSEVQTDLLLTHVLTHFSDIIGSRTPTLYVQHLAETQYNEDSRYQSTNFSFAWYYTYPLMDLQTIINVNSDDATKVDATLGNKGSNANQIAVARILKAYFYQSMTDRWGYLPYSEALEGKLNFNPAYDTQEFIYNSLIEELTQAVEQMDDGAGVKGDFILDGNMSLWAKFANTIRMRLALRLSEIDPAKAKTEFEASVTAGLIETDLIYPFLDDTNNDNPWYGYFQTRTDYAISSFLADTMKSLEDERILAFAAPAADLDDKDEITSFTEINGLDYGLLDPGEVENAQISLPGEGLIAQEAPLAILSLAEVNLALAEASERGWNTPLTATEYYATAIEASWKQWGVYGDGTAYTAYMEKPEVAYVTGEDGLQKIAYQKWIALFGNGYEAWAEWRRLDHPQLTPHPHALNTSKKIPVRQAYVTSEQTLNTVNYNAAIAAQGPDDLDTNLWWDK